MAVGYRAIVRLDEAEDAVSVAESQLVSWFREKKSQGTLSAADWEGEGVHELGPNSTLAVVYDPDRQDGSRRRLYRLSEANNSGLFTVSVAALVVPQAKAFRQTLVVDVELNTDDTYEAIYRVDPPRLIRSILETHRATDGATLLTGEPMVVRRHEAHVVLSAILDPDRTASVIVAPLPWSDGEEMWRDAVRSLTRQSVGVAATFILDDEAAEQVSAGLPDSHGVHRGVIRTFAPHVDLESQEDGLRHPKLHPFFLTKHLTGRNVSRALTKLHARSTRQRFIERELPGDVRRGLDILARAEAAARRTRDVDRRVQATLPQTPPVELEPETPEVQVRPTLLQRLVSRWLGPRQTVTDETLSELDLLLNRQSAEALQWEEDWNKVAELNERLESELRELRSRLDDFALDLAVAEEIQRNKEREASVLRQRLLEQGKPELTYVEPEAEAWNPPDDIMSLIDRITSGEQPHLAFSRVVFTGNIDEALEVEARDQASRYVHALWDYIHVLYDYAEGCAEGRISSGVHLYLKSDHIAGHKCHPDRHAPKESQSTMNQWGHERIRPVPTEIDPSGKVLMEAHFKPTRRDTFAPRMHYYDDTNGSGRVFIGYIGRHLTTKDT
jgi:hypothetical protein